MPRSKGVSAPFFFARFVPSRRAEALLAQATEDFRQGRHADALVAAESVCRTMPGEPAPAVLRAKVLEASRPTLAPRAWAAAWSRDPLNPVLQDEMLRAWLVGGAPRRTAEQGLTFLPRRVRAGTHESLLELLARAGVQRAGACWRDDDAVEIRCFDLATKGSSPMRVVVADEDDQQVHDVPPGKGLRFKPEGPRVLSIAFENGSLLAGSPLSFEEPMPVAAPSPVEPGIDIVIPAYRDTRGVQACLRSVIESLPRNRTRAHIVVVNDASPEGELVLWLQALAAAGKIELVHNRFNLGFIESMNRALRGRRRDALMLNADTLVHGDWIDRLASALDASPDVASVMPWSNNAEIGSLAPRHIDAPCDAGDLARIDDVAARLHASGATDDMEIPTAIGFAMLMRRQVLDAIGLLDGAALTRGYLEEVDWCLRARSAGFRHMLATGVFVAHKGSASFGAEKQLRVRENRAVIAARFPLYHAGYSEFLRRDPLRAIRGKLLDAVARTGATWPRKADASAPRIDRQASLDSGARRIAVWGLHPGTRAETHVLSLARRLAGTRASTRLLVFGEITDALLHTGVVDAIWPSNNADEPLPDHVLASLAGCESLLLADDSVTPPEGIPVTPVHEAVAEVA